MKAREPFKDSRTDSTTEETAMKRLTRLTTALLFAALTLAGCASMSGPEWTTLIDGSKGLENFNRAGDANWRAEDGTVMADNGKGGFLITKNSYKDFQIHAEFWAEPTTNSGIFIRISDPDPTKVGAKNSYEVNIFDQRPEPSYGTGAIVDFAQVSPMPKAGGRWNTYDITARGNHLVVSLNGVQMVNIQNGAFPQGPFALQYATGANGIRGGAIKWRKLQVRQL
jgi:hypothetical protein